jgi:prohibitin 2
MSNRNPFQDYVNRMQQVARTGGSGRFPGGGSPKGAISGFVGLLFLGGGALVLQNSLFNVDGGHRAIKYRRLSGVSKEIYSEGTSDPSGQPGNRHTARY